MSEFQEVKAIMEGDDLPPLALVRAKEHLMQSANLLNLVIACVDKAVAPKVPQIVQTTEFFTACVEVLFKESQHLVDHMPMRPLK